MNCKPAIIALTCTILAIPSALAEGESCPDFASSQKLLHDAQTKLESSGGRSPGSISFPGAARLHADVGSPTSAIPSSEQLDQLHEQPGAKYAIDLEALPLDSKDHIELALMSIEITDNVPIKFLDRLLMAAKSQCGDNSEEVASAYGLIGERALKSVSAFSSNPSSEGLVKRLLSSDVRALARTDEGLKTALIQARVAYLHQLDVLTKARLPLAASGVRAKLAALAWCSGNDDEALNYIKSSFIKDDLRNDPDPYVPAALTINFIRGHRPDAARELLRNFPASAPFGQGNTFDLFTQTLCHTLTLDELTVILPNLLILADNEPKAIALALNTGPITNTKTRKLLEPVYTNLMQRVKPFDMRQSGLRDLCLLYARQQLVDWSTSLIDCACMNLPSIEVPDFLDKLTRYYEQLGAYKAAAQTGSRWLAMLENKPNTPDDQYANACDAVAGSMRKVGSPDMIASADQLHARATRVRTRYNQQQQRLQCLDIAAQLSVTGWNLEKEGIYPMAEKTYRQVVDIYDRQLGESTQTAVAYGDLARAEVAQGKTAAAKQLYQRVVTMCDHNPRLADADIASALERYAELLNKAGSPAQAKQIIARVATIRKAAYAPSANK